MGGVFKILFGRCRARSLEIYVVVGMPFGEVDVTLGLG